jgi:hypothetical protein
MAELNGAVSAAPTEFVVFVIGGEEYKVPTATLYTLDESKSEFDELGPEQSQAEYCYTCLKIVSFAITAAVGKEAEWESLFQTIRKKLRVNECLPLMRAMSDWLVKSGLSAGEAEAATGNGGTGTSEPLPPNSPLTEFALETSTGSSEVIPSGTTDS